MTYEVVLISGIPQSKSFKRKGERGDYIHAEEKILVGFQICYQLSFVS